jgi:sodium-dependent dicarboxylate transporter 2/3/5
MVAGGFALGYGLNASGLAALVVEAALLMPILAVVCTAMGDKLGAIGGTSTVLIGVAIASSSAMVLPISTPPNALAYATNLVKQNDMARIGLILGVVSMVLGYGMLYLIGQMHII